MTTHNNRTPSTEVHIPSIPIISHLEFYKRDSVPIIAEGYIYINKTTWKGKYRSMGNSINGKKGKTHQKND